jgi:hypothetical protein
MLDHDDEQTLAEIEAHLRLDDPDLHRLFELDGEDGDQPIERVPSSTGGAVVRSVLALTGAVLLTTITTLALGPNLGGLIAVISLSVSGMYAYQILRGCPGVRRARRDDH